MTEQKDPKAIRTGGVKDAFTETTRKLSHWMQGVSSAALIFIMLLTVADVCFRNLFQKPIIGTFEIVGLGGALIIGFAIPVTTWLKGHIFVDVLVSRFPRRWRKLVHLTTRLLSIILFALLAWNLVLYANDLFSSGEVTLTRRLPFYPIAYALALCCIVQCLVLISHMVQIIGGDHE